MIKKFFKKKTNLMQPGYIYILSNKAYKDNLFKIGYSKDVKKRIHYLNRETSNPGRFELAAKFGVNDMVKAEKECHEKLELSGLKYNKEYFEGDHNEIYDMVESVCKSYKIENFRDEGLIPKKSRTQIMLEEKRKAEIEAERQALHEHQVMLEEKRKAEIEAKRKALHEHQEKEKKRKQIYEKIEFLRYKIEENTNKQDKVTNAIKVIKKNNKIRPALKKKFIESQIKKPYTKKNYPYNMLFIYSLIITWVISTFVVTATQDAIWILYIYPISLFFSFVLIDKQERKPRSEIYARAEFLFETQDKRELEDQLKDLKNKNYEFQREVAKLQDELISIGELKDI